VGKIERVRKRSGVFARFDEAKLERSILGAVQAAGQENEALARDLADVVTKVLSNHLDKRAVPTSDEIRELVRKALVETGYPQVAECYLRHRKSGAIESKAPADLFPQDLIVITGATRDVAQRWQRDRIAQALIREADLDPATAGRVSARVEEKILSLKLRQVSTAFVRELVNQELLAEGRPAPLDRQRVLGIPKADLREMLQRGEAADPEALCVELGETTLRQFALQEVFTREVSSAHVEGRIHIHGLENPLKLYWGILEAGSALPGAGGIPQQRLGRLRARFSEGLELVGAAPGELAALAAEVARACADRLLPRIVLDASFAATDDPAPFFRALDQSGTAPIRLNAAVEGGDALKAVAHRAVQRGGVLFRLRGWGATPSRFGGSAPAVAQAVSINVPQALARAGSPERIFRELEEAVELAALAHERKHGSGVAGTTRYSIGLQGLADAVRRATGRLLGADEEGLHWAMQVLGFVQGLAREASLRTGLEISLDDILSHRAVDRFTRIDADLFPGTASGPYASGIHPPAGIPVRARLQTEARLGAFVGAAVALVPREDRPKLSTEEVVRLVEEAGRVGRIRRLLIL
jgi:hypothetical protein